MIRPLLLLLCWGLLAAPSIRSLPRVYGANESFSHGVLIPLFAVYAAWRVWPYARTGGARWPGALAILAGSALMVLGVWYEAAFGLTDTATYGHVFLQGVGGVLSLAGFCAVAGGWRLALAWAFPLAYLLFAVPPPDSWVAHVTSPLQRLSAICATWVLRTAGVVVLRTGNVLHLPCGSLGVAEACSGLRSLYVLTAAGAAAVWLGRLRTAAAMTVLALIPVSVVASNTLRIVLSGFFVQFGRTAWVEGGAHDALGLATTSLAACVMFLLARRWRRTSPAPLAPGAPPRKLTPSWGWIGVLCVASVCIAAIEFTIHAHYIHAPVAEEKLQAPRRPFSEFPRTMGPFEAIEDGPLRAEELNVIQPTDWLRRFYRGPHGETIAVTLLYWAPYRTSLRGRRKIYIPHTPDVCYPGVGWQQETAETGGSRSAWERRRAITAHHFTRPGERVALVSWRHFHATDPTEWIPRDLTQRWRELRGSWRSPRRALVPPRYVISVAARGQGGPETWPGLRATAVACAEWISRVGADFGLESVIEEEPGNKRTEEDRPGILAHTDTKE